MVALRSCFCSSWGSDLGCPHSRVVHALKYVYICSYFNFRGRAAVVRGLQLACESATAGIKYGQHVLGRSYHSGARELQQDAAEALVYLRLAAEQGLEMAQQDLGELRERGIVVAQDRAATAVW
jgi:TPR repeat protein